MFPDSQEGKFEAPNYTDFFVLVVNGERYLLTTPFESGLVSTTAGGSCCGSGTGYHFGTYDNTQSAPVGRFL